jgi:hypothetical protein
MFSFSLVERLWGVLLDMDLVTKTALQLAGAYRHKHPTNTDHPPYLDHTPTGDVDIYCIFYS